VNAVVHFWLPVAAVADWFIDRPSRVIPFREALVWLIYPLGFLAYSMARGAVTDWYPYPFLDPNHEGQGLGAVAAITTVILCAFVGLVWVIASSSRWSGGLHIPHHRRSSSPHA
jgi:hypothetical protein